MDRNWTSTDTVQVWVAPLVVPPTVQASLVASLTPAEQARAGRFRSPRDARRFSTAHGWLRHVLGAASGSPPARVGLADVAGKPCLTQEAGLRFNMSRSADLALIAVSGREVGVDVEHLDIEHLDIEQLDGEETDGGTDGGGRGLDAVRVACTAAEAVALAGLAPGARQEAFLGLWTAKEAYLKGRGLGLALPPHQVEAGPLPGAGRATPVRLTGEVGPARWWLRVLRPGPSHVAAVAAEGRDWVVEVRDTSVLHT